jgi:hypothetical protein
MMSRLIQAASLAMLTAVAGCATLRPAPAEHNAATRLAAGLAAHDEGRYATAFEEFVWVARSCPGREAGVQARAALASLELDPRNRAGRPGVGTELLADLILDPVTPGWMRPVLENTYLLSLGLGAPPGRRPVADTAALRAAPTDPAVPAAPPPRPAEDRQPPTAVAPVPPASAVPVRGCGPVLVASAAPPPTLPTLPGPSLRALLAEAETERDQLAGRTAAMETELARLRDELAQARSELERIRRTLRP